MIVRVFADLQFDCECGHSLYTVNLSDGKVYKTKKFKCNFCPSCGNPFDEELYKRTLDEYVKDGESDE